MNLFDFVIVGAGCAGLAVARELAAKGYLGRVLIVEAKQQFDNDKSWSFWATQESPWFQLAPYRWPYSSLSMADKEIRLSYQDYRYCMLPSIDYYNYCNDKLSANTQLRFNTEVETIRSIVGVDISPNASSSTKQIEDAQRFTLTMNDGSIVSCKHLLDTRPIFKKPRYFQQFKGIEVKLEQAISAPDSVRLMEDIQSVDNGIVFLYILPLSPNHLLIEPTYFGVQQQDYEWLVSLALEWLKRNNLVGEKILRTEKGILPMGGVTAEQVSYDVGGIAGNQLKSGSGYGFLNIQQWAIDYVGQFIGKNQPRKKTIRQQLFTLMDDLFIDVLIAKPALTPKLMLLTAMALPDDKFAKFMTEQSSWFEITRLLWQFPKSTFLKALYLRAYKSDD